MPWIPQGNIRGPTGPGVIPLSSVKTGATPVGTVLTDLHTGVVLTTGTYRFRFIATCSGSGTTGNSRNIRVAGTGLVASVVSAAVYMYPPNTTTVTSAKLTALNTTTTLTSTVVPSSVRVEGLLVVTTGGTLTIQGIRAGTGSWAFDAGAFIELLKLT